MVHDFLRLKIELNSAVKFYVLISPRSSLGELKRRVEDLLDTHYSISLPNYSFRTQDGFEIVECGRLAEILEDSQIIVIDPFTRMNSQGERNRRSPGASYTSTRESYRQRPLDAVEVTRRTFPAKNEMPEPIKQSRVTVPESVSPKPVSAVSSLSHQPSSRLSPSQAQPTLTNETQLQSTQLSPSQPQSSPNQPQSSPNQPQPSQNQPQPSLTKETHTIKTDNAPMPITETPKVARRESVHEEYQPPRPDNFKGFVVKKNDLTKGPGVKIDESSFKPLKKRKIEDEMIDLDL